ncbi:metallophosphoesterase [Candidatus Bathyarchaeota archaeon]|nr:metallophosphoesterase [Candidatus Bathyarchaeota archaeon]
MPRTRLFFISDVHGSERCFIKFLNAGTFYKANCIILGGDLTFKAIVPVVKKSDKYYATFLGEKYILNNDAEVNALEKRIRSIGFYPYRLSEEQMQELSANPRKQDELFLQLVLEMIKKWVTIAEDKLKGTNVKCFISPGNDDDPKIDEYLKASKRIIYPEEQVVQVDDHHEMITLGVANITPWHCFRDVSEEVIYEKLEKLASQVRNMETCIFNLHAPPYGTPLDLAPKLDENLKPVPSPTGGVEMVNVGSTSVRKIIEKYQPMLSLHGHIHESRGSIRIGRTLCVNPGSEYTEGILKGFLADITEKGIKDYIFTTG